MSTDGCCFLFFKQKTAYEMRLSDWSSDVCSSDLHDATGLGLPPGIDDGDAFFADDLVIPAPRLWIDRLADAAEQAQRRQVVPGHIIVALAHQRADRGRRGIENVDPMLVDEAPEADVIGIVGDVLEHQRRSAVHQRAIAAIAVYGDPDDGRCA